MKIGIKVRLVNHILYDAIMSKYPSVSEFCRQFGFGNVVIGKFINLKTIPTSAMAARLESALGITADQLFPADLCDEIKKKPKTAFYLYRECFSLADFSPKMLSYEPTLLKNLSDEECREEVEKILGTLTHREEAVIRDRLGFDGNPMTLRAVGKKYGVTPERIRQIEGRAFRRLKLPERLKRLKQFANLQND